MFDEISRYQVFLGVVALAGVVTIGFAGAGLFIILTGGTGGEVATVPESFTCDEFNGDPEVGHQAGYGIDRNTTVGALTSIENATTTGDGFVFTANVSDPSILNVSARQVDGTAVQVTELANTTVRLSSNQTESVRLWIDSAAGGVITRSELDICPPETGGA